MTFGTSATTTDLGFVHGRTDHQHGALSIIQIILPLRNGTTDVWLIMQVLIQDVVFTADKHATWPITATRYYMQMRKTRVDHSPQ